MPRATSTRGWAGSPPPLTRRIAHRRRPARTPCAAARRRLARCRASRPRCRHRPGRCAPRWRRATAPRPTGSRRRRRASTGLARTRAPPRRGWTRAWAPWPTRRAASGRAGAGLDALSGAVRTLHEGQEEARGEIEAHGRALREVREELRRDVSASRDALLRASQGLDARMAEGFGALSGALRDVHEEQAGARRNAEAHGQEIRAALGEAREEQRGGFLALQERLGAWGGELRGEVAGSRDALLRASAGLDARVGALAEAVAQARAQR